VLGSAVGLRPALIAAAIALTLPMLRLLTSPVFRIKDMPPAMPSSPTHLSVSAEPG